MLLCNVGVNSICKDWLMMHLTSDLCLYNNGKFLVHVYVGFYSRFMILPLTPPMYVMLPLRLLNAMDANNF